MKKILEISTVIGCCLGCSYCPQKIHVTNYAANSTNFKMSLAYFKQCLSTIPKVVEIQFAGMAEPFLNSDCAQMILHAHDKGHSVCMYTTCAGMSQHDVESIKNIPFRIFCIHLPDDAGQMRSTVDQAYVDVVTACLKNIPAASLMCVGTVHPQVQAALKTDVIDWTTGLISRAGNVASVPVKYKAGKLKRLPCIEHNVLLSNGDVVLCCCDYALKHTLGNLMMQTYESLFEGEEFKKVLRGLDDESVEIICRNCEIAEKI